MAKMKNLIFISLLVVLFIEVLIVFPSRLEHEDEAEVRARVAAQKKDGNQSKEEPASLLNQKMKSVHLVESRGGTRDWELFAATATGSQDTGNWQLADVRVLFYNKEKVEFTVTGDQGTIDYKSKNLSVVGNVITKSPNGYVFKTPSVYYNSQTRLIESPEEVLMYGPQENGIGAMDLQGRHMKVMVDQSKMLIQEKVSATKPDKDGKKIQITADRAEFSGKDKEAKFLGTVHITYDDMKMKAPEALFSYGKLNILSEVKLSGGVSVNNTDKAATSDTVDLDLLANKYTFKGSPKVVQNNDELIGDQIIFLDGGKKVKVERVRARVENEAQ